MGDRQHTLEQEALRNVRSLVERLDRADREGRKRDFRAIGAIAVVAAVLIGAIAFAMRKPAYDPDEQRQRGCELDAFNARAADFERTQRDANPGMPYRDIQKRLEKERPFLVAAAKINCNPKAR